MTETLLQKLEEKMMVLLTELEESRRELLRLSHENALLKSEKENNARKLADIVSLLEAVGSSEVAVTNTNSPVLLPMMAQA